MTSILSKVLSLSDNVKQGTDNYIDDIVVNNDVVSPSTVVEHLMKFGLQSKPFESMDQSKVLGLKIERSPEQHLLWKRGNALPAISARLTRRELFSVCGSLLGHYPVCNWLRVACSFIKRISEGSRWEDDVGQRAYSLFEELIQKVNASDPAIGRWAVTSSSCRLWCDASSLAMGCALEVEGEIIEDASWLRKREDGSHINLAELDSVLKGLNLVAKWNFDEVEIMTDSATVYGWLTASLNDSHRVKVRGMSEMLVKRRLGLVKEFRDEFRLKMSVRWVGTTKNKADALTRVPKRWLESNDERDFACCAVSLVHQIHARHHLGVDRTYYLAKKEDPNISRKTVADCLSGCHECKSIDPAPVTWQKGGLSVEKNWMRIAVDVTHFKGICYLTMVDCGPSRFIIWRKMRSEDAVTIHDELEQLFRERGPPKEILMDNGRAFHSQRLSLLFSKWQVNPIYRCAFRPEGNAIVERSHRTIKRMAARTNADPLDMVYWYNSTPKDGVKEESVPGSQLNSYPWRTPGTHVKSNFSCAKESSTLSAGDLVFVKPGGARCFTKWPVGRITGVNSNTNVEVDGIPRHVADVRVVPTLLSPDSSGDNESVEEDEESEQPRRSQRDRRPPDRYGVEVYDF